MLPASLLQFHLPPFVVFDQFLGTDSGLLYANCAAVLIAYKTDVMPFADYAGYAVAVDFSSAISAFAVPVGFVLPQKNADPFRTLGAYP